ncbi:MAG: metallophosphoesterase family protein, partial [Nannocystaceae bacterium]
MIYNSLKLGILLVSTTVISACTMPECAQPDYSDSECRVRLENELARGRSGEGFEIRFQNPLATTAESWDARGLVRVEQGAVHARVAGPGPFALSVQRTRDDAPTSLALHLENLDPRVELALTSAGVTTPLGASATPGLRRTVTLDFADEGTASEAVWIRGERPCPPQYRIAVTADVQTGQAQLATILEQLAHEAMLAEIDAEPLLGLVILGDLTEWSEDDEFDALRQLLAEAPVPVA